MGGKQITPITLPSSQEPTQTSSSAPTTRGSDDPVDKRLTDMMLTWTMFVLIILRGQAT